jgi:hypothetical protein
MIDVFVHHIHYMDIRSRIWCIHAGRLFANCVRAVPPVLLREMS